MPTEVMKSYCRPPLTELRIKSRLERRIKKRVDCSLQESKIEAGEREEKERPPREKKQGKDAHLEKKLGKDR